MNPQPDEKIRQLLITGEETILSALQRMDSADRKLLLIMKENRFLGLISIGDQQRAIIRNLPLDTRVIQLIREDIIVAYSDEPMSAIRQKMMEHRIECMPVLDKERNLTRVLFWEDIFEGISNKQQQKFSIPVVIMAGGEGTRLKPLTNVLPKPLIPIGEKTIIENIMDRFVEAGCNNFLISVNYKAEMIAHYFETLKNPAYRIAFFREDRPLGTAGSMFLLKERINTTFFVSNCDILIDQDLRELYDFHTESRNRITIVAALKHYKIPYGTIESGQQGMLESLSEKPEITFKINSGVYLLEPDVLPLIPENTFFHITDLIKVVQETGGKVGVFPISERSWTDYGLIENLPFLVKR